jgi:2-polyprenyl-3-methyl-5-hydroxy-6-metoxy-1,4-benzoquinol methylase
MEKVSCFLCQNPNAVAFHKIDTDKEAPFDVVICQNCKMAYMNPRFDEKQMKDFYDKDYFIFQDTKNIRQLMYAKDAISDIKRFKKNGYLLDIGSAKGLFLLVAKKQGFSVQGLEISEYAADFTNNVFGIDTINGTVEGTKLPKNRFDIITMFDVIEHFRDPKKSLEKIRTAMKSDGLLVVDTPNIEGIYSKFRGKYWGAYSKFHLQYFSKITLTKLLSDAGFKPIFTTSHKIDVLSFDALWRWGLVKYGISVRNEDRFIMSKISPETNAPVKRLYEQKKYGKIKKIFEKQVKNVQIGQSVVMKMQRTLNRPVNRFLNRMMAGDALRIIAQKK